MKWWAQSFLVGVPKITCGFRNDDGVVKVLQTFKTSEIPHETQVGVCLVVDALKGEEGEGGRETQRKRERERECEREREVHVYGCCM